MKITNNTRAVILEGMRKKRVNQSELAQSLGLKKSWSTRLFNGTLKNLDDDHADKIADFLGISFIEVTSTGKQISALAWKINNLMERDSNLSESFSLLVSSLENDHYYDLPLLPTRDLVDFGKEIVRASHENPDKPGKVGKIALTWLALRLKKIGKDNK